MEPLEPTLVPWAQGVGRSNRPAPTNRIKVMYHASLCLFPAVRKLVRKDVSFLC